MSRGWKVGLRVVAAGVLLVGLLFIWWAIGLQTAVNDEGASPELDFVRRTVWLVGAFGAALVVTGAALWHLAGRWNAVPARMERRLPAWLMAVAPSAAASTLVLLAAPLYSDDTFEFGKFLWQLVVVGPIIGAMLAAVPALILCALRARSLRIAGQGILVTTTVVAVLLVVTDPHSTAGIALIYIPFVGTMGAVGLHVAEAVMHRGRRSLPSPPQPSAQA